MKNVLVLGYLVIFVFGCTPKKQAEEVQKLGYETTGLIERNDPAMEDLVPEGAAIEILATGFEWSEGPVWVGDYLLFSDVPENTVYRWSEEDSISVYLKPSGYLGERLDKREPGSNGLALDQNGKLVLCQHGERQVAVMKSDLGNPLSVFEPLVTGYEEKRFNSPNDLVFDKSGGLYFTDPPYGLDPEDEKELDFQGVYYLKEGNLQLVVDTLTRPNGIALSPDEKTLYVAVSDAEKAWYCAFDLDENGLALSGRVLLDVSSKIGSAPGYPDGMKVDQKGNLWATGPGGVLVISPEGKHLGTINTGVATANCGFGPNESVLYMTADMHLIRVKLN